MVNSGHAKHASLGGGGGGGSALRLILVGFGNQALTTVVIASVRKLLVKSGTGDCGYRYR